ncbi:MAG: helix-turn-helix transcriptional regulator [Alphaproteobacteria bacterium]|nr:helix-turn-helix transcriptional regulator [Alphaproteobacteria bacterium]
MRARASQIDRKIGERLRACRQASHRTIRDVADAAGITEQQLQRLETGQHRITIGAVADLADALNVAPGYLLVSAFDDAATARPDAVIAPSLDLDAAMTALPPSLRELFSATIVAVSQMLGGAGQSR